MAEERHSISGLHPSNAEIGGRSHPVIDKMMHHIQSWEKSGDKRFLFLSCYATMTGNMAKAIRAGEFEDPQWVEHLMTRFAEYYFEALERCDCCAPDRPRVWVYTHRVTSHCKLHVMQYLLLGINAHINYDLVLTLSEILAQEQSYEQPGLLASRRKDHLKVNQIIAETVDAVQDQIIEKQSPAMDIIDKLLGRVDEYLLSSLIQGWRNDVWRETMRMLETDNPDLVEEYRHALEEKVLGLAHRILLK